MLKSSAFPGLQQGRDRIQELMAAASTPSIHKILETTANIFISFTRSPSLNPSWRTTSNMAKLGVWEADCLAHC